MIAVVHALVELDDKVLLVEEAKERPDATFERKLAEAFLRFGPRCAVLGPWRGAGGCGVAAQGRPSPDESDRKQASREERAMIEALRTRSSRSTMGRARARR
jgi:hypothetical protein